MSRVIHFEIPADDPARAAAFYEKVLGWKFQKWDGPMEYWLVQTGSEGPDIDGGMVRRQHPGHGTVNTVGVASVDEAAATIVANGGTIAVPKMAIPGVGWVAYCKDPDGNIFGLHQEDRNAK